MGGLKKKMPITYWTMLIGALALAGCPPFAGFFSKDEILYSALANGHFFIWLIGVLVAAMTAYYTFRMIFVVFHGQPRDQQAYDHAHEAPLVMTVPLIILAIGALFAGFYNLPAMFGGEQMISHWLAPSVADQHPHGSFLLEFFVIATSVAAFAFGLWVAYKRFGKGAEEPVFTGFARFAYHKFYVDELYDAVFVRPYKAIGAEISEGVEPNMTDAPVTGVVRLYMRVGTLVKVLQSGYVRVYAIYMVLGLGIMSFILSQSLN